MAEISGQAARRSWGRAVCSLLAFLSCVFSRPVVAQELVPAAYTPAPVGVHLLTASMIFNTGDLSFEPTAPIEQASADILTGAASYAQTFGLLGRASNITVSLPWISGELRGLYLGEPAQAERDGFGDMGVRLGVNLVGAPSLTPREFADYRPGTLLGVSLSTRAPTGEYDGAKLINIGTNRWAFKPEIGLVQVLGTWAIDAYVGTWLHADNGDFLGGSTREQKPIMTAELHLRRAFGTKAWASLDANFWGGGRTTVDGIENDDRRRESRVGTTVALRLSPRHTIRFAGSIGAISRIGGDFTSIGLAYAYSWVRIPD